DASPSAFAPPTGPGTRARGRTRARAPPGRSTTASPSGLSALKAGATKPDTDPSMSDWKPQERAAKPGAPPGWGTAFPPEKPRRDAPSEAPATPPPDPAATPAVNAYAGVNPYAD